uniref:Yir3 protein n=1 Tax=Parastrongyloides trichosuri TaxID=131310 RepID=A0A0N4ZQF3_PARTI
MKLLKNLFTISFALLLILLPKETKYHTDGFDDLSEGINFTEKLNNYYYQYEPISSESKLKVKTDIIFIGCLKDMKENGSSITFLRDSYNSNYYSDDDDDEETIYNYKLVEWSDGGDDEKMFKRICDYSILVGDQKKDVSKIKDTTIDEDAQDISSDYEIHKDGTLPKCLRLEKYVYVRKSLGKFFIENKLKRLDDTFDGSTLYIFSREDQRKKGFWEPCKIVNLKIKKKEHSHMNNYVELTNKKRNNHHSSSNLLVIIILIIIVVLINSIIITIILKMRKKNKKTEDSIEDKKFNINITKRILKSFDGYAKKNEPYYSNELNRSKTRSFPR